MILTLLLACASDDILACKDACDLVYVECADFFPDASVRECYAECRQSTWAGGFADEVERVDASTYNPCGVYAADDMYQSPCYAPGVCE